MGEDRDIKEWLFLQKNEVEKIGIGDGTIPGIMEPEKFGWQ